MIKRLQAPNMGPQEVLKTEDSYPPLILDGDNAEILDINNVICGNEAINEERNTVSGNTFSVDYSKLGTAKCRKYKKMFRRVN